MLKDEKYDAKSDADGKGLVFFSFSFRGKRYINKHNVVKKGKVLNITMAVQASWLNMVSLTSI